MADEKSEITKVGQEYAVAASSGDLSRWASTLSDDVVFQPPDHPQVNGRTAVVAWAKAAFFEPFKMQLDFSFDEIEVLGTWAFARGLFTLSLTPRQGGSSTQTAGKFMNIFKRDSSGSWKYSRAGFSFDAPVVSPAST
jgi:ketosteroid isomerase-like protein